MKAIVLASLMAVSAINFKGCTVANNNKQISGSYGGGYFYISGGQIHVRNNDRIGSCDTGYLYAHGIYEFSYDGTEWVLGYENGAWTLA